MVQALVASVPPLEVPGSGDPARDLGELALTFVRRLAGSPLGRAESPVEWAIRSLRP